MSNPNSPHEARVAVLVDCDNVPTDIVEHALLMVAQFGRVVLRRRYGSQNTLANKWQEVLVRQASTQFQASGEHARPATMADHKAGHPPGLRGCRRVGTFERDQYLPLSQPVL